MYSKYTGEYKIICTEGCPCSKDNPDRECIGCDYYATEQVTKEDASER